MSLFQAFQEEYSSFLSHIESTVPNFKTDLFIAFLDSLLIKQILAIDLSAVSPFSTEWEDAIKSAIAFSVSNPEEFQSAFDSVEQRAFVLVYGLLADSTARGATATEIAEMSKGLAALTTQHPDVGLFKCNPYTLVPFDEKDAKVCFLKATDPAFLSRLFRRKSRKVKELIQLQAGQVGHASTGAKYKYASPQALEAFKIQKAVSAAFLEKAKVFDSATGESIPLKSVAQTPEMLASKRLAFLKAMERLATEAGLQWAMLTITMPAEFHPNPAHSSKKKKGQKPASSFNGVGFDEQQKYLSDKFQKVRSMLAKAGISLSGVRVHEPQADGTPHWHVLFFFKTQEQLTHITRCFFFHFPAFLRVRKVLTGPDGLVLTDSKGRLRFDVKVFDTVENFLSGTPYQSHGPQAFDPFKHGCQCQLDIGAPKVAIAETDAPDVVELKEAHNVKVSSMSSYVMKYVNKTTSNTSEALPSHQSLPLSLIGANRQTWGIRSVQLFGVPAIAEKWDMLRKVDLKDETLDPLVREFAELAQMEKGQGAFELMKRSGGLKIAPTRAEVKLSTLKAERETRHGATATKATGIVVETPIGSAAFDGLKSLTKSIRLPRAVEGLEQGFSVEQERVLAVSGAARHLTCTFINNYNHAPNGAQGVALNPFVQSTAEQAQRAQHEAFTASITDSHALIAGAGCGKSHTLVQRVKHLLASGVSKKQILVFSFTKASAEDLRSRLFQAHIAGVSCSTMHSFARSLLKPLPDFVEHSQSTADQYLEDVLTLSAFTVQPPLDGSKLQLSQAQEAKIAFKRQHGKRYYVLVDEAQDLNALNYRFINFLAKTIFAVGDFRQSIYQFRGARPDLFQSFKDGLTLPQGFMRDLFAEQTPAQVHSILTTFRNSKAVNAMANAVSAQLGDESSFTSALDTSVDGNVFTHLVNDDQAEYQAIKSFLETASVSQTRKNAVLCRTRAQIQFIKPRLILDGFTDVEVQTIHASKGLEFHNVVIVCGSRSDREDSADFPNLSYVAITRAENDLLLTSQGAFPAIIENALEHCKAFQTLPAPV